MDNYYKEVKDYFAKKANKYDLVDNQLYWKLSDDVLKEILKIKLINKLKSVDQLAILDAGAGTGRWSFVLYELLKDKKIDSCFDLVDITREMLNEADKKIEAAKLNNIFKTHLQNIEDLSKYKDNYYDIAISFYNVLSFVNEPLIAIKEVFKKIKPGGIYLSVVANKYHSYFFNILNGNIADLDKIGNESLVRFNSDMPSIHCFTPNDIYNLYLKAGFEKIEVIGFPNLIYPNIEDTMITGQNLANKNILENKESFQKIKEIELKECFNSDISGRGNALLIIGIKK
jgi:ubiquinone/menaquinone biosynthesis C-methylase UbiE